MKIFKARSQKKNSLLFSIAVAGTILSAPISAQATEEVYWTSQPANGGQNGTIEVYNPTTGKNTVVDSSAGVPDSLIFANSNTIIYTSNPSSGSNLYEYNTATHTNTLLAPGTDLGANTTVPGSLRDLALTPSGNSVLVSSYAGGTVYKVNITTGAVSSFITGTTSTHPQGIVFADNNLFLNLGSGIEQLNPTTGALINSNITNKNLDGLTYDPKTGFLFATSGTTGGDSILQINPTTLAEKTLAISGAGVPSSLNLDGIEAIGNGNLIIADYNGNSMLEYATGTTSTTVLTSAAGIDDVSPLVGLGGSDVAGTPEPGTFVLFGTGILLMSFLMLRSRKNPESC